MGCHVTESNATYFYATECSVRHLTASYFTDYCITYTTQLHPTQSYDLAHHPLSFNVPEGYVTSVVTLGMMLSTLSSHFWSSSGP